MAFTPGSDDGDRARPPSDGDVLALQPGHDPDPFGNRGHRAPWFSPSSQAGRQAIASPLVGQAARTFHGEARVGHAPTAATPSLYMSHQARLWAQHVVEALYGCVRREGEVGHLRAWRSGRWRRRRLLRQVGTRCGADRERRHVLISRWSSALVVVLCRPEGCKKRAGAGAPRPWPELGGGLLRPAHAPAFVDDPGR